jgi:hypothetical protein
VKSRRQIDRQDCVPLFRWEVLQGSPAYLSMAFSITCSAGNA